MRRSVWEVLLVAAAALAVYLPGIRGPVAFDDGIAILSNPRILDPGRLWRYALDPSERGEGPTRYSLYPYRPLTEASLLAVAHPGGGLPAQRVFSLVLHVACALCVLALARRLAFPGALWASLFFALHPLAHQAAGYAAQRSVVLETLLFLLCLLGYLKARQGGGRPAYFLALLSALLACGAKETAVLIPLLLGFLEWILREPGGDWRRALARWAPFVVVALVVPLEVWRASQGGGSGVDPGSPFGRWEYLKMQGGALWGYLCLHGAPLHLGGLFSSPPKLDGVGLLGWLPSMGIAGLLLFAVLGPRRLRSLRLCLGLVLLPQALESGPFPMLHPFCAYRCYPGLAGAALAFGGMACRFRALAAVTLALFGSLTFRESSVWAHPVDLQRWHLRQAPAAFILHQWWGLDCLDRGRTDLAAACFRKALLGPIPYPPSRIGLAICLGQPAPLPRSPFPTEAILMADKLKDWGRLEEAEALLRRSLVRAPWAPGLWEELGVILTRLDRLDEAQAALRKGLELEPEFPQALNDLAAVLALQGRVTEAEAEVRKALRLNPDYAMAWTNLALILEAQGRKEPAAEARRRAKACPPDYRLAAPPQPR